MSDVNAPTSYFLRGISTVNVFHVYSLLMSVIFVCVGTICGELISE